MTKANLLIISIFLLLFLSPIDLQAQGPVYTYEKGKTYCTLELDTEDFPTWGTYRAMNYHSIPYFEMTFLADKKINVNGSDLMIVIPTYYNYAYLYDIKGHPDTLNMKKQELKFYFYIKDNGKIFEYIAPDEVSRKLQTDLSSFNKKLEIDITSFPLKMEKNNKPKWHRFPLQLRLNLWDKFEYKLKGGFGTK